MIRVIKKDGTKEDFNVQKVVVAVNKSAYRALIKFTDEELEKSYISGITYSGGDPLYVGNREAITALAKEIREKFPEKTQWLYTGYEWNQIQNEAIIPYLDVVVDGRFEVEQKDTKLHWKGSANQKVIDVQDSLKTGKIVLHDA